MNRDLFYPLIAMVLAIATATTAFQIIDAPPMTRAEVSDWIQGLGSIAAVLIAVWAASQPARDQARLRQKQQADFARAVLLATNTLERRSARFRLAVQQRDLEFLRRVVKVMARLTHETTLERLMAEPASQWPSIELLVCAQDVVTAARGIHHFTGATLEKYADTWGEGSWRIAQNDADILRDACAAVRREVAALGLTSIPHGKPPSASD